MFRRLSILLLLLTCFSSLHAQSFDYAVADPYVGGNSFTLYLAHIDHWHYPLPGAKVISPYGGSRRLHTGVDLKTFPGDSIRAAFDGIVIGSGDMSGYGNCVVIRHAFGIETLYSHNRKNMVSTGDYVHAGQVVALTGRTGRATTEHLHFEVQVAGRRYDPQLLFDHESQQLRKHRLLFQKNGNVKTLP